MDHLKGIAMHIIPHTRGDEALRHGILPTPVCKPDSVHGTSGSAASMIYAGDGLHNHDLESNLASFDMLGDEHPQFLVARLVV